MASGESFRSGGGIGFVKNAVDEAVDDAADATGAAGEASVPTLFRAREHPATKMATTSPYAWRLL